MSELSAKSLALLHAARSARPASAARDRMGVAIAARIGAAALVVPLHGPMVPPPPVLPPPVPPPVLPPPLASAATTGLAKGVVLGAVIGCLGVGVLSLRPSDRPSSPSAVHGAALSSRSSRGHDGPESAAPPTLAALAAASEEIAVPPVPASSVSAAETATSVLEPSSRAERSAPAAAPAITARAARLAAPANPVAENVEKPEKSARSGRPERRESSIGDGASEPPRPPVATISLGEETALLRDALGSLKQGDGAQAITKLDDLAARHPTGVLREERLAARVLALCAAGRVDEAREAGRRFLEEMPTSVQADRVRASCVSLRR